MTNRHIIIKQIYQDLIGNVNAMLASILSQYFIKKAHRNGNVKQQQNKSSRNKCDDFD